MKLFESFKLGNLELSNRMVMAPLTRSRSTADHVPQALMATYYGQRATAGLIITEGTSPSLNGAGYPRIPGIYNAAQTEAWKQVTQAVHENGGKIFLQIMHTGRVTHPHNLDEGGKVLAPSAIGLQQTKMYTDQEGELPIPPPQEMNAE
ncbi:MAG: alkene reductase, partial [Bacteroidota bacterium]